ncbi:MAG: hypothetical protein INR71_04685 [Terriglobus roseus]|nr:hypothetical protein [Terriglobus roseus]
MSSSAAASADASHSVPATESSDATSSPPDHYTEGERDVYNAVKAGLDPVALEVSRIPLAPRAPALSDTADSRRRSRT